MTANEWLGVIMKAKDVNPAMEKLIRKYGEMLLSESYTSVSNKDVTEPYMGWCDVEGCDNESASNGSYYKDTGYWCLCTEHSKSAREGKPQYFMKQSAIDRENSRDKITGYLPSAPRRK